MYELCKALNQYVIPLIPARVALRTPVLTRRVKYYKVCTKFITHIFANSLRVMGRLFVLLEGVWDEAIVLDSEPIGRDLVVTVCDKRVACQTICERTEPPFWRCFEWKIANCPVLE